MLVQVFEGSVVHLPSGFSLVDVGFQKHESIVLLLKQKHDALGMLAVASLDKLPFQSVIGRKGVDEVGSALREVEATQCIGAEDLLEVLSPLRYIFFSFCFQELLSNPHSRVDMEDIDGLQQRKHLHPGLKPPMVVSVENIATVFSSHRVVHYDLEAYEDSDKT